MTSYLTNSNFRVKSILLTEDKKCVFRLFQFLSFSQRYFISEKDLLSQKYYLIEFRVKDFMDFMEIKNKNYYQLKKTLNFLDDLQNSISPF